MSLTRRGRITLGLFVLLVLIAGGVGAVMALGGSGGNGPSAGGRSPGGSSGGQTTSPPPPECPLSGLNPKSVVPSRPALAVKVENLPAARPQTGLSWADIVYEEPVEGGITRFIAVYQCQNASRIEPVRSGRLTDVNILVQFGRPLFAYAGARRSVIQAVRRAGIIDINYNVARVARAYHRDVNRTAPHNLYTSTKELYSSAKDLFEPRTPDPIFTYSDAPPEGAMRARKVHVPFSSSSDVFWKWSKTKKVWLRFHGTVPHVSSDGTQFSAKNVVVQVVKTRLTDIVDANGVRSPLVISVGTGKAYVFRDGKVIKGRWERDSAADLTKFVDTNGDEIPLTPGNTWVELLPENIRATIK
ncbi:MAG TPA: DUF3048 domain-containing protein [Actinomycetota bacterium]|nr:DUF3048 domain-containing protein [Actinomycetota bacterium]